MKKAVTILIILSVALFEFIIISSAYNLGKQRENKIYKSLAYSNTSPVRSEISNSCSPCDYSTDARSFELDLLDSAEKVKYLAKKYLKKYTAINPLDYNVDYYKTTEPKLFWVEKDGYGLFIDLNTQNLAWSGGTNYIIYHGAGSYKRDINNNESPVTIMGRPLYLANCGDYEKTICMIASLKYSDEIFRAQNGRPNQGEGDLSKIMTPEREKDITNLSKLAIEKEFYSVDFFGKEGACELNVSVILFKDSLEPLGVMSNKACNVQKIDIW